MVISLLQETISLNIKQTVHTVLSGTGFLYSIICNEKKIISVVIIAYFSASVGFSDTTSRRGEEWKTEYLCIVYIVSTESEGGDIVG